MSTWLGVKTEARSVARKVGLTPIIQRLERQLPGRGGYEIKVRSALEAAVLEGDVVWDVGANVGLYTLLFSKWVGATGEVVAFEPVPSCFADLSRCTDGNGNVRVLNLGLGDADARLPMYLADDDEGTTHTFVSARGADRQVAELEVRPGDAIRSTMGLRVPNVMKIDVEGFELEALRGLDETLRQPECRAVLCEVHFGVLEARGHKHGPSELRAYLRERGFETSWIDPSHLVAIRGSTAG
jgi:FkbM family methyltransferase